MKIDVGIGKDPSLIVLVIRLVAHIVIIPTIRERVERPLEISVAYMGSIIVEANLITHFIHSEGGTILPVGIHEVCRT